MFTLCAYWLTHDEIPLSLYGIVNLVCMAEGLMIVLAALAVGVCWKSARSKDAGKAMLFSMIAVGLLAISCFYEWCVSGFIEELTNTQDQAPAAWVELTDRFEELPELPPDGEATYVVTDREAGATYVAVVGKGGTDVQLTYLEPAAPDAQGEGDRQ